jgi:hypothetical protein
MSVISALSFRVGWWGFRRLRSHWSTITLIHLFAAALFWLNSVAALVDSAMLVAAASSLPLPMRLLKGMSGTSALPTRL